jgi:hypothetical protein
MRPELAVEERVDDVCPGHKWAITQTMPLGTVYVYLCTGEVKPIANAGSICMDEDLLCVCGYDGQPIATFPREDVYLCTHHAEAPTLPPC